MTVKEVFKELKDFKKEFTEFRNNEFFHLQERVDNLSVKIAWIVGIISTISVVINIIIRILPYAKTH